MFENLPFFPEQASEQAAQVDALFFFLVAVSAFFAILIAMMVAVFAVKFHRRRQDEVGDAIHGSIPLELFWTFIPLGITMVMFVWGAWLFFHLTVVLLEEPHLRELHGASYDEYCRRVPRWLVSLG